MAKQDREECAIRLVGGGRFISVLANNILAFRGPAWSDARERLDCDVLLVWPLRVKPASLSTQEFKAASGGPFKGLDCTTLGVTWEQCLGLSVQDWRAFREATHEALTRVRTRKWPSNIVL